MTPDKPYPQSSSYSFYGFFRQDSILKRNYLRLPAWSNDSLLMDYSLQVGDTVKRGMYLYTQCPTPNASPLKVVSTDSITVSGKKFRVLYTDLSGQFYDGTSYPGYFLIEGLGHINGILEYWSAQEYYCHPFENCVGVDTVQFNAGALGIRSHVKEMELKVFPVPVTERLALIGGPEGNVCPAILLEKLF